MAGHEREALIETLHQQRTNSFRSLQLFSVEWRAPHGGAQRYRARLRATTPRGVGLQFLGDYPNLAHLPEGLALSISTTTESGILTMPLRVARYDPAHGVLAAVIVGAFSQCDRRRYPRADVELIGAQAAALDEEGEMGKPFSIQMVDLSRGGAQFICRAPLGLLDLVQMVLPLGEAGSISPVLRVLNSSVEETVPRALRTLADRRAGRSGMAYRVRGVFVDLNSDEGSLLGTFMEQVLTDDDDESEDADSTEAEDDELVDS